MDRKIKKLEPKIHKLPTKKKVAAYARVSSGKDAMFHSLSAQISYYSERIQKNPSWLYIGVYADNAMTGTKDERPGFQRLIEDCKSGKIDMVIVKSISRFARNTVTLLETVRELKAKNIDVFFENENIHSMSRDGELMLSILASFAQEESRSVSENCKWRIRKKFEKGKLANLRFLYGYNIKKGEITVNDEQAWIVKYIFNNYVSGENYAEIARNLSESHSETLKKHEWTLGNIRRVLKNEKYAGNAMLQKSFVSSHLTKKQQKNKGELPMFWDLNTHTPIVDKYTFDLAQEKLKQNFKKCNIQAERNLKYPFTGKIKCGICGKNFRRKTARSKHLWHCSNFLKFGKSKCTAKQIPEEILKAKIAEILGLSEFGEEKFNQNIKQILVPTSGTIIFYLKDSEQIKSNWENPSRSQSWTEEMKQKAREKAKWHKHKK